MTIKLTISLLVISGCGCLSLADEGRTLFFGAGWPVHDAPYVELREAAEAGDQLALRDLTSAAETGVAKAQGQLGLFYAYASEDRDEELALEWFHRAARKGDVIACLDLSQRYANGVGVKQSDAWAEHWLQRARPVYESVPMPGLTAPLPGEEEINWEQRIREDTEAAEAGDIWASLRLALIFDRGSVTERDPGLAARWYRQAAEGGNGTAQVNLAFLYLRGDGVPQSKSLAAKWFAEAADQGGVGAMIRLAEMYLAGEGVEQNDRRAVELLRAAADEEVPLAVYKLGLLYLEGRGVEADPAEAARWFQQAAELYSEQAMFTLGKMYLAGRGVPRNPSLAVHWFREAAWMGHVEAQFRLARCFDTGLGVEKEPELALYWYRRVATHWHEQSGEEMQDGADGPSATAPLEESSVNTDKDEQTQP